MKLKKVEIKKYKSFENSQEFEIENDITILVGMNESGKTSILEAIAKTNYFQDDESFKFNTTHLESTEFCALFYLLFSETSQAAAPQHFLYFFPLPQTHRSFRPIFAAS